MSNPRAIRDMARHSAVFGHRSDSCRGVAVSSRIQRPPASSGCWVWRCAPRLHCDGL